jgi:hypothetical protein
MAKKTSALLEDSSVLGVIEAGVNVDVAQKESFEDNIIGCIVRDQNSAKIDLKESEKIVEYAMLNSQMIEAAEAIANIFGLGKIENVCVEGKKITANCKIAGETKTCVFMNKNGKSADSTESGV